MSENKKINQYNQEVDAFNQEINKENNEDKIESYRFYEISVLDLIIAVFVPSACSFIFMRYVCDTHGFWKLFIGAFCLVAMNLFLTDFQIKKHFSGKEK